MAITVELYPDGPSGMTAAEIFAPAGYVLRASGCHSYVIGNAGRGAWKRSDLMAEIKQAQDHGVEPCPDGEQCEYCNSNT